MVFISQRLRGKRATVLALEQGISKPKYYTIWNAQHEVGPGVLQSRVRQMCAQQECQRYNAHAQAIEDVLIMSQLHDEYC